jgi:hypothetical protein
MVTQGGIGHYALAFTVGSISPHVPTPAGEAPRLFGHTGGTGGSGAILSDISEMGPAL